MTFIPRFSRKVLWAKLCSSNNDPRVIARFFLETILKLEGKLGLRFVALCSVVAIYFCLQIFSLWLRMARMTLMIY